MSVYRWRPVPGQQVFKSILGMILDPGEGVCQVDLRIMAVQFDRLDDGQDVGDALTALVRAGKQPIFPANSMWTHGSFSNVVVDFDPAIVDVDAQGGPSRQGISHRLGQLSLLRQS